MSIIIIADASSAAGVGPGVADSGAWGLLLPSMVALEMTDDPVVRRKQSDPPQVLRGAQAVVDGAHNQKCHRIARSLLVAGPPGALLRLLPRAVERRRHQRQQLRSVKTTTPERHAPSTANFTPTACCRGGTAAVRPRCDRKR